MLRFMHTREHMYMPDEDFDKYMPKTWDIWEEDGVGPVGYCVLQDQNPSKVLARHLFEANPKLRKIYMALRDNVSYNLEEDMRVGRKVREFTRNDICGGRR